MRRVLRALEAPLLVVVPLGLIICARYQVDQSALLTVLVALVAVAVLFAGYETSRPSLRQIVPTVVMAALAAAGRILFAPIPDFKPVTAICIIAGAVFGRREGFMTGALAALASNFFFGQGLWTPWQMYAMGIIGFLAGLILRSERSRRPLTLAAFGAFSAIVIYGGIMNPVTALIWGGEALNGGIILTYYATGFPMDVIHAAASALFLGALSTPMLEKFERLKTKYNVLNSVERSN